MSVTTNELNVKDAAAYLRVTTSRIYELIHDDRLTARKVSERCWLVSVPSLDAYASGDRKPGRRRVQNS